LATTGDGRTLSTVSAEEDEEALVALAMPLLKVTFTRNIVPEGK
jgi:hypothetical protein